MKQNLRESSSFSARNARVKLELARLKARQHEELSALEEGLRRLRTRHALHSEVGKLRPAGRMRPARRFCAARELKVLHVS